MQVWGAGVDDMRNAILDLSRKEGRTFGQNLAAMPCRCQPRIERQLWRGEICAHRQRLNIIGPHIGAVIARQRKTSPPQHLIWPNAIWVNVCNIVPRNHILRVFTRHPLQNRVACKARALLLRVLAN